jgi:type IV pilus assembly protein PilW
MNPAIQTRQCERGFSLIELMLAMLIGTIIIGGVLSLFVSTRDTQRTSEDQLQLSGDARFAIETIAYDLRHTGYWGDIDVNNAIVCRLGDPTCQAGDQLPVATGDCSNGWYADTANPIIATYDVSTFVTTCTSNGYMAGTDVLGLHLVDTNTVADDLLAADIVYMRSNTQAGGLFVGNTIPTTGSYEGLYDWAFDVSASQQTFNRALKAHVYYVSTYTDVPGDNMPSLRRTELKVGPVMDDQVLLSGVEDFHVQFGVDIWPAGQTRADEFANTYVNADNIPLDASGNIMWSRVRTVKIWLLMRAERQDRDNITSAQTFTLGNNLPDTYNDGFRRFLVSSVVKLRNSAEIDILP